MRFRINPFSEQGNSEKRTTTKQQQKRRRKKEKKKEREKNEKPILSPESAKAELRADSTALYVTEHLRSPELASEAALRLYWAVFCPARITPPVPYQV